MLSCACQGMCCGDGIVATISCRPVTLCQWPNSARSQAVELSLANAVGQLHAGDRHSSRIERLQSVHGRASSFDRAMILLNDVVEVLAGAHLDVSPQHVLAPKQPQCSAA